LGLALIGVLFWLLRKRRQQKTNPYHETAEGDGDSSSFSGGAAGKLSKKQMFRNSAPNAAEIDGNPVGAARPISTIQGHAELASGNGFQPGHSTPYGPDAVGIGGGTLHPDRTTWDSMPPQYSPGQNQISFSRPEASELADTSVAPTVNEKGQQQYVAYRPPQPAAEMPTIKTPPEDVEKQLQQ
jgi:hypothetical protein